MNVNNLRDFFRPGRKENGSYMGATESASNATERNLSCLTEEDILALKDAAECFVLLCEREIGARILAEDLEEEEGR